MTVIPPSRQTVEWLLAGDPSIRWQTLRDLVGASGAAVRRERSRVAREGWGARLLHEQDASGTWAGGLYTPKWTSTTYTMLLLRDLGLPATNDQARKACGLLLERGFHADGGINYGWPGGSETCVTGIVLSVLAYFQYTDARLDAMANHLLDAQMPDGGWNCRRPYGATHGSMHTTMSVLEALRLFQPARQRDLPRLRAAERRGREFLLAHRLFRSHRTGRVIKSEFTRFVFPPRWHYDVLRALDYFRTAGAPRDARLADAIDLVRARQRGDGRWRLTYEYAGKRYFQLEPKGAPSRWNTLRALRVLTWWDHKRTPISGRMA